MAELYIFDQDDNFITILNKDTGLVDMWFKDYENHIPDEPFLFNIDSKSKLLQHIVEENQAAFYDREGNLRLMRMKELYEETTNEDSYIRVKCEPSFLELHDHFVEDRRVTDGTAQTALNRVLEGSRYVGEVTVDLGLATDNFYWIDGIESVFKILNTWGGSLKDTITLDDDNEIIGRKLWIVQRLGTDNGLIVEPDYNAETISRNTLSYAETALWGQGASLETEGGGHTRYITFEDVEWKVSNGDPVDKPLGQKWVGDPQALANDGLLHNGVRKHKFGHFSNQDYDDPEDLLWATWQDLQERKLKEIIHEATIYETDKEVSLGDTATIINRRYNKPIELQSQITGLEYDPSDDKSEIKIVVGKYIDMNEDPLQKEVDELKESVKRPTRVTEGSFPDRKPSKPINVITHGGIETIQLYWDYADEIFIKHYEVYGSQIKDFVPDTQHLLWRGQVSAFAHTVGTEQKWYYRIRAMNYHGTASDWSDQVEVSTKRILTEDILFGEEMAERLRDLNRISDIIGEGGISLDNLHDDIPDYMKQQAKEYTDDEIYNVRTGLLDNIADLSDELEIVDGKLFDKANKDDVYTIRNIDDMFDNVVSSIEYETDIDGFVERFENAETRLYQNETAIGSMVKQDDFEDYGDIIDRRMSDWEQTADGFLSSVNRVRADLDGLEIGGRNLITLDSVSTVSASVDDYKYTLTGTTTNRASVRIPHTLFENSTEYVVSFKVKKISGTVISMAGHSEQIPLSNSTVIYRDGVRVRQGSWNVGDQDYPNDNEEHHYEIRFRTTSDVSSGNTPYWYIQPNRSAYGENYVLEIWDWQLEKGNKATDWTPAPEDMDERMTISETTIRQLSDDILLKVDVDNIVSEINLKKEGIRIAGDVIHLDGLTLIDDAIIKATHIADASIERAHLRRAIIDDAHIDELTGNVFVVNSINADRLNVSQLSAVSGNMGTLTSGILQSNNNNMYLNLNTGVLTMRNANFTLGNGARIDFTSTGNRIQFRSTDGGTVRSSGMGVGRGNSGYPFSYLGTTGASDLDTLSEYFTGVIVTTTRSIDDGGTSSFVGRRWQFRNTATGYDRGMTFDWYGTPTISFINGEDYEYDLQYLGRISTRRLRIWNPNPSSSFGYNFETTRGDIPPTFFPRTGGSENYYLGTSIARWHRVYMRNAPEVSSDERMKSDIIDIDLGFDFINDLQPKSFLLNQNKDNKRQFGIIAQQLETTFGKHDINTDRIGMLSKGDDGMYGVQYEQFIPILMQSDKDIDNKFTNEIARLEGLTKDNAAEIQMMKARIKQLEGKIA